MATPRLAFACAGAGIVSFATLLLPRSGMAAHLAENLTWGLIVAAVVCALLAADQLKKECAPRLLIAAGLAAAAIRALLIFAT